jgi:hypothetical protein
MSDPSNQRADGCSVFFTFLVLALLLCGFFLAQRIFEPDTPSPVSETVDSIRHQKAQSHRDQDTLYKSQIDNFHADSNTTLEDSMKQVIKNYQKSAKADTTSSN